MVEIPEDQLATYDPLVFNPIKDAAALCIIDKVTISHQRARSEEIGRATTFPEEFDAWCQATQQDVSPERAKRLSPMLEAIAS